MYPAGLPSGKEALPLGQEEDSIASSSHNVCRSSQQKRVQQQQQRQQRCLQEKNHKHRNHQRWCMHVLATALQAPTSISRRTSSDASATATVSAALCISSAACSSLPSCSSASRPKELPAPPPPDPGAPSAAGPAVRGQGCVALGDNMRALRRACRAVALAASTLRRHSSYERACCSTLAWACGAGVQVESGG